MDFRPDAIVEFVSSLTPSLIGSAVAQAWKPALTYRQRFLQWVVGSTVSYYASLAIISFTGWSGFVAQSISFGIALVAFDATPIVAKAVTDAMVALPQRLADQFFGKKG